MKKYRVPSFLLALALAAGLAAPTALASEAPADTSPAPVVTPKEPVESAILNEMEVDAAAAILVDADPGTVLYEQNARFWRRTLGHCKHRPAFWTHLSKDSFLKCLQQETGGPM